MKLWKLQSDLRKFSFYGSFKMGVFQLWCGTHIYQLVTKLKHQIRNRRENENDAVQP